MPMPPHADAPGVPPSGPPPYYGQHVVPLTSMAGFTGGTNKPPDLYDGTPMGMYGHPTGMGASPSSEPPSM